MTADRLQAIETRGQHRAVLERTFYWPGPTARIDWQLWRILWPHYRPQIGDVLRIAGAKVTVTDYDPFMRAIEVSRSRLAALIILCHRLFRFARLINARIILTLDVWGLAEVKEGELISWQQVRVVKRLKQAASELALKFRVIK